MTKPLYGNKKLDNYIDDVLAHTPNWQGHITVMRQFLPRDSYAKRGRCRRRVSVCVRLTLVLYHADNTAR